MKKHILSPGPVLLACWLVAGSVQAQNIYFTGDTFPTGDFGGRNEINQNINIAEMGEGSLSITSGAVLNTKSNGATIAINGGSTGTALVSDGSVWNMNQATIGRSGTGFFNILSGSKVTARTTVIGSSAEGSGTLTVDGPGSSWTIPKEYDYDFWIGMNGGTGTIKVLNGGTVSTTSDIYASYDTASSSHFEVDGPNSLLQANSYCWLGMFAPTTVKITNGAVFRCGYITYLNYGRASLSGAGSIWSVGGDLDIGVIPPGYRGNLRSGGKATLDIGEGSTVMLAGNLRLAVSENLTVGGSGTLNIEGSANPGVLQTENVEFGAGGVSIINFKHSNTSGNYRFSPNISGRATINVTGSGTTVLTGNNTHSSYTSVQDGVLRAGSATAFGSNNAVYSISRAGTLDTNNYSLTSQVISNAGIFTMGTRDTSAVATVNSEYRGSGGTIRMNAVLGGNNSATQKLVVGSNTTGTTTLHINNIGGTGAQTTGNGILVVQVGQLSYGRFNLPAPGYVQAGAYRYTLVKVGRDWYLQSAPSNAKAAAAEGSTACSAEVLASADKDAVAACQAAGGAGAEIVGASAAATASALTKPAVQADGPTADGTAQADGSAALDGAAGLDDSKDGNPLRLADLEAGAVPVPTLGALGIVSLSSIMGLAGLRRSRRLV